jgi:hypothetical protein
LEEKANEAELAGHHDLAQVKREWSMTKHNK